MTPTASPVAARVPIVPAVCTIAALIVLVVDHYNRLPDGALWLAVATLALGVARTVDAAARARAGRGGAPRDDRRADPLGNRRRLFRDLEGALERGSAARLALFDLNGFKSLNDSQGHVAGDRCCATLGARLRAAVDGAGAAYRLGGDEFCVLLDERSDDAFARACAALEHEHVTASLGSVLLGVEAAEATQALRLADARMYAHKTRN